jgi:hypothetical protein
MISFQVESISSIEREEYRELKGEGEGEEWRLEDEDTSLPFLQHSIEHIEHNSNKRDKGENSKSENSKSEKTGTSNSGGIVET